MFDILRFDNKRSIDQEKGLYIYIYIIYCYLFVVVLRTLGIPTRSITNFNSAHDTDKNDSHDIYLDEEGEEIEGMSADSIW